MQLLPRRTDALRLLQPSRGIAAERSFHPCRRLGYGDPSPVINPQGRIRTPQLDRLASQGVRDSPMHIARRQSHTDSIRTSDRVLSLARPLKQGVIWTWADPLLT